ncbi:MAG: T9SS type A sorting domain-containing protein [Flavobacterium sp.]|nr:MAG: T9SS type A sorting domain-containing protein [Flavobacterium sp.]
MKKILLLSLVAFLSFSGKSMAQSVTVFDEILFYDGYAAVVDPALYPVPDGVIRHRNDLYAKKFSDEELASFGNTMTINVTIGAACDNYDRIGNVNLVFVPKGATTYDPNNVSRMELARFITPFMNKNVSPTSVPYTFSVNNVARIFKDQSILAAYDIWAELQVFGVPYAAQTQVAGCAGQIDVFYGTLEFTSNTDPLANNDNFLLPLSFQHYLNNYQEGASDAIGTTDWTINFDLPAAVNNASFYLITSNHGANSGGEEYIRRNHYIYFDDVLKLTYKPGGASCEPYRQYNTQPNGIYGPTPRPFSQWASFSNWCPGQVIPIRQVSLGNVSAGPHSFKISVPQAAFADEQGYFPVSVYLQGSSTTLGIDEVAPLQYSVSPNPTTDIVTILSSQAVTGISVFNLLGQKILEGSDPSFNLSNANPGIYIATISFANGSQVTAKIVKK